MANNQYPSVSVSVTTTPHTLLSLLQAVDGTISPRGRDISLQSNPGGTGNIFIGNSSSVSSTNCGYVLAPGGVRQYRADEQNDAAPLGAMWVVASTGTIQLNVEIVPK